MHNSSGEDAPAAINVAPGNADEMVVAYSQNILVNDHTDDNVICIQIRND